MENGPFEDVFPIKMGIFHCYVSLPEGSFRRYSNMCVVTSIAEVSGQALQNPQSSNYDFSGGNLCFLGLLASIVNLQNWFV